MAFKKTISTNATVIVAGGDQSNMFPVGFTYTIEDTTYEIVEKMIVNSAEFRKLKTSDGRMEELSVESILKDLQIQPAGVKVAVTKDPDKKEEKSEEKKHS